MPGGVTARLQLLEVCQLLDVDLGGQVPVDRRLQRLAWAKQSPRRLTAATLDQALDSLVELLLAHSGGRLNDDLALVLAAPAGTPSGISQCPAAVEEAAG
jgi:hypothetical protein